MCVFNLIIDASPLLDYIEKYERSYVRTNRCSA